MTHQEFDERLDEIARDCLTFDWLHKDSAQYESKIDEAKQAIDRLFLDVVGDDLPTDMHGSWTRRKDGSMLLLSDEVVITNKVKQQLRTTITGKEGGDE